MVDGRAKVLFAAGVAAGVDEAPKPPNAGAEDVAGAAPVEAPPNKDGFAASPGFAAPPNPKVGVEDAPAAAPPPNRPPAGLLAAGVPDDAPPKRPEPPELGAPPPKSPPPAPGALGVLDAPKMEGDEEPVAPEPPKSPPAGFEALLPALLPLGCPNVKPDMVALGGVECRERRAEVWDGVLVVARAVYADADL